RPPRSPLFPYTTLFRSHGTADRGHRDRTPHRRTELPELGGGAVTQDRVLPHREHRGAQPRERSVNRSDEVDAAVNGRSQPRATRSEEHTSELQSQSNLV